MFCKYCGADVENGSGICTGCGRVMNTDSYTGEAELYVPEQIIVDEEAVKRDINRRLNRKVNIPKTICIVLSAVIVLEIIAYIFALFVPMSHYSKGEKLYKKGEYEAAMEEYADARGYKDSEDKIYISEGKLYMSRGKYDDAAEVFLQVKDCDGVEEEIFQCGIALLKQQKYSIAYDVFACTSFEDTADYMNYSKGMKLLSNEQYTEAIKSFESAYGVMDSYDMIKKCNYCIGDDLLSDGNYEDARSYFVAAGDYEDAEYKTNACDLLYAEVFYKKGYLNKAQEIYKGLPEDLEYDGISVSSRLSKLKKYKKFVAMCGRWEAKSDCSFKATVTFTETGYAQVYSGRVDSPTEYITVTCVINSNGKVTVSGSLQYQRFTSIDEYGNYTSGSTDVEFSKKVSSVPNKLKIANNVYLTYNYSSNKYTLKYNYTDTSDEFYTYEYVSEWSYSNNSEDY